MHGQQNIKTCCKVQAVKLIKSDRKTRVMKDPGKLDNLHIANILLTCTYYATESRHTNTL